MRVLITGIGGQDGYYLSRLLLQQGHQVYGSYRGQDSLGALEHLLTEFKMNLSLYCGDVTDRAFLRELISSTEPEQIYNLAAQSRVGESFPYPEQTFQVNALAPLYLLELIRELDPRIRFFQACSAEVFGESAEVPQTETTKFAPASPYAVSKASAFWTVSTYRRAYGLFACNGILYSHESPLRDESFLSGKVVHALARIVAGKQKTLRVGNLNSLRDWGFAGDYVEAMYLMMNHSKPDDYIITSGQANSVQKFIEFAFEYVGLDWHNYVEVDQTLYRPTEVSRMVGSAAHAYEELGWQPRIDFQALVRLMVDAALAQERGLTQVMQPSR